MKTFSRLLASTLLLCLSQWAGALPPLPAKGEASLPADAVKPRPGQPGVNANMPAGDYVLRIISKGQKLERPVTVVREGNAVSVQFPDGPTLTGSINANGQFSVTGAKGKNSMRLQGMAVGGRCDGTINLSSGKDATSTTITLDHSSVAHARQMSELKPYVPPEPDGPMVVPCDWWDLFCIIRCWLFPWQCQ